MLQINLFLRVMRRRDDGYHDLASLFHVRLSCPSSTFVSDTSWCNEKIPETSRDRGVLSAYGQLIQVIDFGDSLDFTPISSTEQDELSCNWDDIPLDSSNLVIKVQLLPEIHLGTPDCL